MWQCIIQSSNVSRQTLLDLPPFHIPKGNHLPNHFPRRGPQSRYLGSHEAISKLILTPGDFKTSAITQKKKIRLIGALNTGSLKHKNKKGCNILYTSSWSWLKFCIAFFFFFIKSFLPQCDDVVPIADSTEDPLRVVTSGCFHFACGLRSATAESGLRMCMYSTG